MAMTDMQNVHPEWWTENFQM